MAKFKPGQSGNPKGRPPKERALTNLLESAGNKTVLLPDGRRIAGKRFVAAAVWEVLTTGQTKLADGRTYQAELADWLTLVKFLYGQVDGPPRLELEHSGNKDNPLLVRYINDWRNADNE